MPVTTRSQKKNYQNNNSNNTQIPNNEYLSNKLKHISYMKNKLSECENAIGKQNKINIVIELFKYVVNNISYLFENEPNVWIKLLNVLYLKAFEMQVDNKIGLNDLCELNSVEKLMELCKKIKSYCKLHIMNPKFDNCNNLLYLEEARELIKKENDQKQLRQLKRVNYKGMGGGYVMELDDPDMAFEPNPEIGFALSRANIKETNNDPDYIYEEDEDDEDDKDYVKDNYMNILY